MLVDEAHITTLAVDPEHRRKGIAERLTVELLQTARDRGMLCATLEVRASNIGAIELYRKIGFEEAAIRKRYYPDNQEDALIMWLYRLDEWKAPA